MRHERHPLSTLSKAGMQGRPDLKIEAVQPPSGIVQRICGPQRMEGKMSDEQTGKVEQMLQNILSELRRLNAREEQRDEKAAAVQHRFDNLV